MISHQIWELKLEDVFHQHLDYLAFMHLITKQFINGKWVEDLYEDEIIMYKDKNIPYREDILKTFENVKITKENAHLIAPILAELENEKNMT